MKYEIDNHEFEVIVTKKNNKNTYIRIKEDGKVYVTTSYLVSNKQIDKLINSNKEYILNSLNKINSKNKKKEGFYYLGKEYNIIIVATNEEIKISDNNIIVKDEQTLNKWIEEEIKRIYKARLYYYFQLFEEEIPYPKLKFRKMKTRWGVCNKRDMSVTLNTELIKYDISAIDYVIVHELSHFIHFNHSKSFWNLVSKYYPDYKKVRKYLKD